MPRPFIVVVACVTLVLGAFLAERALSSDLAKPGVTTNAVQARPAITAASPTDAQAKQAVRAPVHEPSAAEPQEAKSGSEVEAIELEHAEALLSETSPGADRLQAAHRVLTRCVQREPTNLRCLQALAIAETRLGPQPKPELRTLSFPAPNEAVRAR